MHKAFSYLNVICFLVWVLTGALFFPLFLKLYGLSWKTADNTHTYFVLPIFLWFVWRKRIILRNLITKQIPTANYLGLSVFIFSLSLFIFGQHNQYLFISTLSFVFALFGLANYLYGPNIAKVLYFPFLYLLLLVPIPKEILDTVTLPMRYGVSAATEIVLSFFGYPITREGLLLTIDNIEIFMGSPCSGYRSLITLVSLSLLYVYVSKSRLLNKYILILAVVPIALTGNFIRVISIFLITYYFGEEAGQGFFHGFSGIVVFSITLVGFVGIDWVLKRCMPGPAAYN